MKVETSAPSNIALIKYMGKTSSAHNHPTNRSFSWTLENLRSFVSLESDPDLREDIWSPLEKEGMPRLELSEKGQRKFLGHLDRVRSLMELTGYFRVSSVNNFPSDCGIASSASSFAALTKAVVEMGVRQSPSSRTPSVIEQAEWSRRGSGSSCRSFLGPWVLWSEEGISSVDLPFTHLLHQVVLVDGGRKAVSSSEAHQRCLTSLLFQNRPERAEKRLQELLHALNFGDWEKAFEITWAEFWDMHALFETSQPAFGYMRPGSLRALAVVRDLWSGGKDGPLTTMDAGANVHLLWRPGQETQARQMADDLSAFATILGDCVS